MNPQLPSPASKPEMERLRRRCPDSRLRLQLQAPDPANAGADHFPVPLLQVRRAIVRSYARGIYDSRVIASGLTAEISTRPGARPVRVDPERVREVRRLDRSSIESDLALLLAGGPSAAAIPSRGSGRKLGAIFCLHAARERVRLAAWVDRLSPTPDLGGSRLTRTLKPI